jgi:murein DD-endopeptidase MepM/ murein hydrolase activator NlpD
MGSIKSYILILLTLVLTSSCAMRSGHYVQKNGKWTFVTKNIGFLNYFENPRVDNTTFDYKDTGKFKWPVPASKRISSFFGPRHGRHHDGIDIAAKRGATIIAAADGKVKFSGKMRGYGNVIVLEHKGGYHTVYAHNSRNIARKGQGISQGEVIGKVGSTGRSSGPHLHFEIRRNNKVANPGKYIEWIGRVAKRR